MNFQSGAGTCNAHPRCCAGKNSTEVNFIGLHGIFFFFFFPVLTMEVLPRQKEHLSPGLSTNDIDGGSQHPKQPREPCQRMVRVTLAGSFGNLRSL